MSEQPISSLTEARHSESSNTDLSTGRIWTSRILGWLAVIFLLMDGGMKLFKPAVVVQSTARLGYPESMIVGIGVVLLVCSLLYVIPRTAVLGAILLTGYLGGAVASNVRAAMPLFNSAFPILFAVLIWARLVLRRKDLASLLFKAN